MPKVDTTIPSDAEARYKSAFVRAEEICVTFPGNADPAVGGISLDVAKGEVVAVIGPSGSGKSTFLRCLNHLQPPTSGKVTIDGVSIVDRPGQHPKGSELALLRRKVGMVFQNFNLFPHLTALDNVTLAQVHALGVDKQRAKERGLELLEMVGLADRAGHRPSQCSGGQQQRIAIARALALDPKVILFDEPTSALDPELGAEVLAVMRNLVTSGMSMIVGAHEMGFAEQVADRVIFMDKGAIVEQGAPRTVLHEAKHERTQRFLSAVMGR